MGSDLYESYVSAIAASMVLGVIVLGAVKGMLLPLALSGVGIVVSIIGALSVRPKEVEANFEKQVARAHATMNWGVYISTILMIIASGLIIWFYVGELGLFWALISGLIAGLLIAKATEYFTSAEYGPVKKLARAAESGAAVTIIEGIATGLMSTVIPILLVAIATVLAYLFGGLLGIAIASMGMLINLGMSLAMDCYGPIADNSAGIAQMAGLGKEVRERCEALDSVGNTTAALGKGFAIASAALASLAWLATYFEVAKVEMASLTNVAVITGVLIGGMLTEFPERCRVVNPATYITPSCPPFYLQHGTADHIVPYLQSINLARVLTDAIGQEKVILNLIENVDHFDPIHNSPENIDKALDFLDVYMRD